MQITYNEVDYFTTSLAHCVFVYMVSDPSKHKIQIDTEDGTVWCGDETKELDYINNLEQIVVNAFDLFPHDTNGNPIK